MKAETNSRCGYVDRITNYFQVRLLGYALYDSLADKNTKVPDIVNAELGGRIKPPDGQVIDIMLGKFITDNYYTWTLAWNRVKPNSKKLSWLEAPSYKQTVQG